MVILIGDFYQFPPVQGQPRNKNDQDGRLTWRQSKQVMILHEQTRQSRIYLAEAYSHEQELASPLMKIWSSLIPKLSHRSFPLILGIQ